MRMFPSQIQLPSAIGSGMCLNVTCDTSYFVNLVAFESNSYDEVIPRVSCPACDGMVRARAVCYLRTNADIPPGENYWRSTRVRSVLVTADSSERSTPDGRQLLRQNEEIELQPGQYKYLYRYLCNKCDDPGDDGRSYDQWNLVLSPNPELCEIECRPLPIWHGGAALAEVANRHPYGPEKHGLIRVGILIDAPAESTARVLDRSVVFS